MAVFFCCGVGPSQFNDMMLGFHVVLSRFPDWDYIWRYLVDRTRSVPPQEAVELVSSGKYVLIDVRQSNLYEEAHAEGAVNVPLFQSLTWSKGPLQVMKGIAYVVNGVQPVEANPDFVEGVKKIAEPGVGVIMYCEAGGTLEPSTNFMTGKTSRSLKAAYRVLAENVAEDVLHLDGGLFGYFKSELPMTGEYNSENAGKTPASAKAPEGDFISKK